ncbi:MAG: arylsulfatase [Candidatus Omnitrophota bacterium]
MPLKVTFTRREFLEKSGQGLLAGSAAFMASSQTIAHESAAKPPNVILILTDDQGYGDLGVHGNDKIRTPNIDRFAGESVEFTQFFVSPVCAPTRASLMTGRYNYRTGVVDTYLGRAMMHGGETTLAELLGGTGYRTGIFGKWHLGDNYPMRPIDQGFQEALVHNGGGIGQPADPPGNRYHNPILQRNGKAEKHEGYCTDIFTSAAIGFIRENRQRPFFCYLATNAPHTPLQIDDSYVKPYLDMGLDETTAKVYGMVTNIDDNIGNLLAELRTLGLERNTIVIFLTDNGPQQTRYTAGLRGLKGQVYEGGIRTSFFIRWPERIQTGAKIDRIAAHIDILPTLLEACGVSKPDNLAIDGKSLLPLLTQKTPAWPDRTLYFQWHRGDEPILFRNCAARGQRYKLINGEELYDMNADPGEKNDIAAVHPDIAAAMRKDCEKWFRDVSSSRGYAPPRIQLGTPYENPTILTRQDWRGPRAGWSKDSLGYWEVETAAAGTYKIILRFDPVQNASEAHFQLSSATATQPIQKGEDSCIFSSVSLNSGAGRLEAWIESNGNSVGVNYVDVSKQP